MNASKQSSPDQAPETFFNRLTGWRLTTAGVLTLGYGAFYICRTNLTVVVAWVSSMDPTAF